MKKVLLPIIALVLLMCPMVMGAGYDPHTLSDFDYRTVRISSPGDCLVFQTEPGGSVMSGYQFWNGDKIYVNLYWREKGYTIAYQDGVYGFVDASYIDWGGSSPQPKTDPHDLSYFGYRTVSISTPGDCLVFQSAPAGPVIKGYQFWNGDSIYVNLTYREKGYAIAYQNGVYGYVDAGYINWSGSGSSSGGSTSTYPRDLSYFGYRTVSINTPGDCLVFQSAPAGSVMSGYQFWNGDSIYVNLTYREKGYALAYQNGVYGYVDASYINWSGSSSSGSSTPSIDPHDLSYFGYRTVRTNSPSDCLVFQSEPAGAFMSDYKFWNGDSIYVNLTWRERGYTIAYQNGVYGFVDASYINW
ncbi:MAG: hypothetical protein IKE58_03720 [Blautia sp.]|nr:hypothetical protein [Blautia sp.]